MLENKPTGHRAQFEWNNVETSEFDFMERGEQDNPHGKLFQMICQKVNNMIQPSQNFQFI